MPDMKESATVLPFSFMFIYEPQFMVDSVVSYHIIQRLKKYFIIVLSFNPPKVNNIYS